MPFTVSLTNPVDAAVSVSFATSNGTAIAPGDFTATTQSVNFVAGQVSQTVNVPIVGDVVVEPSESFNVAISALNAGVLAGNVSLGTASGTGTINNDDAAIPVVSISGQSGLESATPMSFTVSLDVAATQASSVLVTTSNGTATTADNDYSAVSQTVNFAVGQLSQTVTVPIINDSKVEANESFSVTLSAPNNLTLGTSIGTGTINNDDSAVVSVGSNTLAEGNGPGTTNMPFTVSLTNPVDAAVSVSFATSNGTAIAPGDYTATTQSVSFAAGQVSQTVNVPIVGDVVAEPNESFNVAISALNAGALAGNVSLGTAAGTGTINNDDSATVGLVGNVSVVEGNAGLSNAQFTVSLSAASNSAITVNYATADGTATLADNDYQAQSGSLTFAPGTTSLTINVPVIGDTRFEPNETFLVNLSAANGATLGLASATATISNDDVFATLAVPTLRSTALILLGVMLGVLGIFAVARQQR